MTKRADYEEADKVFAAACDACPAVHINLQDDTGEIFASAVVPVANCEPLIKQIREASRELSRRHSAPRARQ